MESTLQQKLHYKEVTPFETVVGLKKILKSMDVEVTEDWQDQSSIGTYALRLTFSGTNIGANGKGVTKEFALASAYAELFERYQNELLGNIHIIDSPTQYPFLMAYDEKLMSAEELIKENNSYIDFYFRKRGKEKVPLNEKVDLFSGVQKIDLLVNSLKNQYLTVPFYSVRDDKVTYLPKNIYRVSYGSNGMSAGNTLEEAIVQGLSEIIERHIQKEIFVQKPTFPDIPDEYIRKFPYVFEMYEKARKNGRFKYLLKDCSMGGKYPVAALIIIEKDTGKYGVKLGCHPDYGVAIERCFTEAAQGQDILEYSGRSTVDFYNKGVDENINIYNTFKVGKGQFPYQMFGTDPTYPFTEVRDVSNKTNEELAVEWCKEIISDGYDILIRDVSYLGFPSVHIIVPGLSEMFEANDTDYRAYNTRHFVCGLLQNPKEISPDNTKYIIAIAEKYLSSILENSIESYYPWYERDDLPAANTGLGSLYLVVMCHILNKDFAQAANRMKVFIETMNNINYPSSGEISQEDRRFYQAIYYYCSASDQLKDETLVKTYLSNILDERTMEKVLELMEDPSQVIIKQYPDYQEYVKNYVDPFPRASIIFGIREKLRNAQVENPTNQIKIGEIFKMKGEERYGKQ